MFKQVSLILALMCCSTTYAAGIYKWVDEKGNTQYSATPPTLGTPYETLSKTAIPSHDPKATMQALRGKLEENKNKESTDQTSEDRDALRTENCKLAKVNLDVLKSDRDVVQTDTDGNKILLQENQREQAIRQTEKDINYFCNP